MSSNVCSRCVAASVIAFAASATHAAFGQDRVPMRPVASRTSAIPASQADVSLVPPAFDVATIRLNKSGARQRSIGFEPGGRFVARNMPLRFVIGRAFGEGFPLPEYLLDGGPDWITSEPYDIEAVPDRAAIDGLSGPARAATLFAMLRTLLAERFSLRAHWEPRERPVYAMVPARGDGRLGPQLVRASGGDCRSPLSPDLSSPLPVCGTLPMNNDVLRGVGMTMAEIMRTLQFYLDRPVVDRTMLTGQFTFEVKFALELPGTPVPDAPSIFSALPDQLGLRLEARRDWVDILVIDHVDRPTAD